METSENVEDTKKGFFRYVFNFDDTNKAQLMNFYQYMFIAVPLVLLSLKSLNYFSPDVDDDKGTLEILFEIIISLNWIILTIWFINKIIRYIPTKSGMQYPIFNEPNFIIAFLIVLFTMNTKIGNKINILIERLLDLYNGKTNLKDSNNNKNSKTSDIKTTQPISNNMPSTARIPMNIGETNPLYSGSANHHSHNNNVVSEGKNTKQTHNQSIQPERDFNNSFSGPNINNLVNSMNNNEPVAANDLLGSPFVNSVF